jgi:hypothetical protein
MGFEALGKIAITTRVSFDGGSSWSEKVKIPHENGVYSSADPSMAFDKAGNVYLAYIDFDAPVESADSGVVLIRKSTDGGLTWGESYKVTDMNDYPGKKAIDRPWIVIDNSGGIGGGIIYITSMNAKGAIPPYNPYVHISSDNGKSWQHKYLDSEGYLAGQWIAQPMPTPAVSSDGTFHSVYPSFVYSQGQYPRYIHVASGDGGNNLDYSIAYQEKTPFADSLAKKAGLLICDKSNPERLAFLNISAIYGDGDVFLWETFDKGNTWQPPVRINDDTIKNGKMQDLLWADFNETGDLFVSWRDRRNAPDNGFETSSEIWGAVKYSGKANFEKNFRISDNLVPYDTILGASSGNDFQCVRFTGNVIYTVWGSNNIGFLNIWFAKSILSQNSAEVIISNDLNTSISVSPNPVGDYIDINYNGWAPAGISIYNTMGNCVMTVSTNLVASSNRLNISHLCVGVYFIKIGNFIQKFEIAR